MAKILGWIVLVLVGLFAVSHLLPTELTFEKSVTETEPAKDELLLPSLEERVGQLLAVGHWASTPVTETERYVRELGIGSIIIMEAPADESAILEWTDTWQSAASTSLLISIDQEGGVVSRLRGDNHIQLSQPEITDTATANAIAVSRAKALAALGINSNYAPVIDRSIDPESFMYDRVFRDPEVIASLGDAMVRGYQSNGVLAVPKHYPGHPDTSDDSHITLPILDLSADEYYAHTEQFADLFNFGNTKMLMTAHVQVNALDLDFPATVSNIVIDDLRIRLGYEGVIITDDLAMQAISDRWSHEEAAVLALDAGVDMIMLAAEPERTDATYKAILDAVRDGTLTEAKINRAYERVTQLKNSLP